MVWTDILCACSAALLRRFLVDTPQMEPTSSYRALMELTMDFLPGYKSTLGVGLLTTSFYYIFKKQTSQTVNMNWKQRLYASKKALMKANLKTKLLLSRKTKSCSNANGPCPSRVSIYNIQKDCPNSKEKFYENKDGNPVSTVDKSVQTEDLISDTISPAAQYKKTILTRTRKISPEAQNKKTKVTRTRLRSDKVY